MSFATRRVTLPKFSDTPFTGRIVTAENGSEGKYIADESWRNGKKDGVSTRWFSNGEKCTREITLTESGTERLPDGGLMVKKCMFVHTPRV